MSSQCVNGMLIPDVIILSCHIVWIINLISFVHKLIMDRFFILIIIGSRKGLHAHHKVCWSMFTCYVSEQWDDIGCVWYLFILYYIWVWEVSSQSWCSYSLHASHVREQFTCVLSSNNGGILVILYLYCISLIFIIYNFIYIYNVMLSV